MIINPFKFKIFQSGVLLLGIKMTRCLNKLPDPQKKYARYDPHDASGRELAFINSTTPAYTLRHTHSSHYPVAKLLHDQILLNFCYQIYWMME